MFYNPVSNSGQVLTLTVLELLFFLNFACGPNTHEQVPTGVAVIMESMNSKDTILWWASEAAVKLHGEIMVPGS